jgi:aspartyl-tRNA(Asn)/glutamyl-tRNA(Gln) amidotransferase subunit C
MEDRLKLIETLEALSEIALSDDEKLKYATELGEIFAFADEIKEADVNGLEPSYVTVNFRDLRPDEPKSSLSKDELNKNAKIMRDDCFVTAKVVE